MDIKRRVKNLIERHGTNNPFKIAKELKIIIIYKDLGNVKGYFRKAMRKKVIVLNENLEDFDLKFTCAHELAHALYHNNKEIKFLLDIPHSKGSSIFENQANEFAFLLLMDRELEYDLSSSKINHKFVNELRYKYRE